MIYKNGKNVTAIYKGSTPISKVYKGSQLVWQHSLLPSEYQQVEYIESTGTQYFEIDYIANEKTNSRGTFQITDTSSARILFGARKQSAVADFYGLNWGGGAPYKYVNSYYMGSQTNTTIDTQIHTFEKNAGVLKLDGVQLSEYVPTVVTWNTICKVIVFGCNSGGKVGLIPNARIFNLQISEAKVLFDLIPCYRKSDGKIGMYDIVNNVFYTSQGTDEFLKGKDI